MSLPPRPRVKDYANAFFKDFGKVFAVRWRRPKKNRPRRHSSTNTTDQHGGDDPIHAQIPSAFSFPSPTLPSNSSPVHSANGEPGLDSSTNVSVSSARYSGSVSLAREASDMAQLALPMVQAVASVIPFGAPMQAAIGGLLTSLQAIDVRACMIASPFLNFKVRYRDATRIRRTSTALYYDSID
ncbi:hypothetical protein CY34DRAFT_717806 [Suillus luteus UH-Slu-Lm8-n1]|uniref:Uncharacterized protein n=1 Tax=Suillus luteus UH-Slu-Lm8-n1 TaxID=930992 RepID=A0A0D0A508_9AGAM|nr:hypothetical protein CY34DRAFT_717806 [Suillus luteus UH-Slu-Lm8-n1]